MGFCAFSDSDRCVGDRLLACVVYGVVYRRISDRCGMEAETVSYITAVGFPGLLAGALLASSFFLFILSVMRTTVANSLFLMSTSPFVAALFGWLFLNEQVRVAPLLR